MLSMCLKMHRRMSGLPFLCWSEVPGEQVGSMGCQKLYQEEKEKAYKSD